MFSVSNIAWSPEEEDSALDLLRELGIAHMEVAPGRLWPQGGDTPVDSVPLGMQSLTTKGLGVSGFQAILFGKPDLRLFNPGSRPALMDYLKRLAALCSAAGGTYLVFGAPKNRWVPEAMSADEAFVIAVDFFKELGEHARKLNVTFGIEANPAAYGCNFCTHVDDLIHLVSAVDSPGVRWHADTGELAMNSELLPGVVRDNIGLAGSLHVSEPNLGDFSCPWSGHEAVRDAIRSAGYCGPVSLEMKRPANGLEGVRKAAKWMIETYAA